MSDSVPEDYKPLTREEFERDIDIAMKVMRARNEIGAKTSQYFVAKKLADKLWQANIRPYRGPGLRNATSDEYPDKAKPPVPVIKMLMVETP